jgi:formamidopyrimidine-DNA glycosylase
LEQLQVLVEHIRQVIRQAIEAGGSSLNDFTNADGDLGYFQHSFDVYNRADKPCKNTGCTAKIERIVQGGRSSFYCPSCQK